ncbi:MAG: EcsC family protein, partial [Dermatophilaceae bacterium]
MEIFGVDHHDSQDAVDTTAPAAFDDNATARVTRVFEHLMDVGIDGKGPFDSAQKVADVAMVAHPNAERAIDAIVRSHLRLAAVGGFVTSLGGFVTLPIALP